MDETDVDSYFYHNILDISQSNHRTVRVSKGSNKKSFAFKVNHFCDLKLQQRFILKEEVSISKKEIESLLDSSGEFLKAFDQANKVSQIPLPKPEFEIGSTKAKDERTVQSLLQGYNWEFKRTNSVVVSVWKKQELCLFHQKVWTIRWAFHSYRSCQPELPWNQTSPQESIFCCLQVWHFWEQLQCVVHSPLIVGITIALLFSFGTFIVQKQSVWVNIACTKRHFNLSAEAIINARNAHLCARSGIFLLKIKQIPFSCRLVLGFTFSKRVQSQFKMLLEMCIVSVQRNTNLLVVM